MSSSSSLSSEWSTYILSTTTGEPGLGEDFVNCEDEKDDREDRGGGGGILECVDKGRGTFLEIADIIREVDIAEADAEDANEGDVTAAAAAAVEEIDDDGGDVAEGDDDDDEEDSDDMVRFTASELSSTTTTGLEEAPLSLVPIIIVIVRFVEPDTRPPWLLPRLCPDLFSALPVCSTAGLLLLLLLLQLFVLNATAEE